MVRVGPSDPHSPNFGWTADGSFPQRRSFKEAYFVMNHLIANILAGALLSAPALAELAWQPNFEAAKKLAAEEKKDLFLSFSSSNAWGGKLKEEIFEHKQFADEVRDEFVLVVLDYPKDKSGIAESNLEQNAALRAEFAIRIHPTIMLCDAEGRPYAELHYLKGGPGSFFKQLAERRKNRALRDDAFASAGKAEGTARAGHLERALRVVPPGTLTTIYRKEFDELRTLNGKAVLVTTTKGSATRRKLERSFRDYFVNKDFEGACKAADEMIAKDELAGELKQRVLFYKLNACIILKRPAEALNTVAEIREVAPESHLAKDAERLGEHLQAMKARKVDQPRQESKSEKPAPLPNTGKNKNGASSPAAVLVIAQKDQEAVEAPPAEEKKKEAKAPNEGELKSGLAKTRKALQAVKKKIDADHEAWENSEEEIAGSKARRAELEAALENERVRYKKLLEVVARIEKEHNGDHDRAEELEQELAAREKAWAEFESKQDEITKLEKIAAELRRQAEKLRKRAEDLRKN